MYNLPWACSFIDPSSHRRGISFYLQSHPSYFLNRCLFDHRLLLICRNMLAERFQKLQIKWRSTLVYFNWCLLFFGTVVGLLIIFLHCDEYRRGYPAQGAYFEELLNNSTLKAPFDSSTVLSLWTDDYAKLLGTPDINGAEIFGPFLGMCLPALMDLLVELYVTLTTHRTTPKTMHSNNVVLQVVRLSILERFVFIIGVMGNAFFIVIPNDWNMVSQFYLCCNFVKWLFYAFV